VTAYKQIKLGNLKATKFGRRSVISIEARRFIAGEPVEGGAQ
jgi:hypothetical protein